ncbi:copper chaperone PCu(A)C [Streptomyces sp. NPDC059597]|uniref:copper chaperone PCu(A)C n=1 Tax=Streptomyces sp. NPDC059597 TaxID=3346879 RepID=UPI00369E5B6A
MRRSLLPATLAALAGALALTSCGADSGGRPELSAGAAYMPQPVSADMAAGFLTVTNKGGGADELTSVSSDIAGEVTMHSTSGGAMTEKTSFTVPAHGRLVFKSGANHLMFEGLKHKPREGQTVTVKLGFAHSKPLTVEMPVRSATYTPSTGN